MRREKKRKGEMRRVRKEKGEECVKRKVGTVCEETRMRIKNVRISKRKDGLNIIIVEKIPYAKTHSGV